MNISPPNIIELAPNEIFVFGSNLAGRHGKGAAKTAMQWGAVRGEGVGAFGRTYAIPTKDRSLRPLPLAQVALFVAAFIGHATLMRDKKFLVTAIGCGLAQFAHEDMARLFFAHEIPDNVFLPKVFWDCK